MEECEGEFSPSFLRGTTQTDWICCRFCSAGLRNPCCRQKADVLLDIYVFSERRQSDIFTCGLGVIFFSLTEVSDKGHLWSRAQSCGGLLLCLRFLLQPATTRQQSAEGWQHGGTCRKTANVFHPNPNSLDFQSGIAQQTNRKQLLVWFLSLFTYIRLAK